MNKTKLFFFFSQQSQSRESCGWNISIMLFFTWISWSVNQSLNQATNVMLHKVPGVRQHTPCEVMCASGRIFPYFFQLINNLQLIKILLLVSTDLWFILSVGWRVNTLARLRQLRCLRCCGTQSQSKHLQPNWRSTCRLTALWKKKKCFKSTRTEHDRSYNHVSGQTLNHVVK